MFLKEFYLFSMSNFVPRREHQFHDSALERMMHFIERETSKEFSQRNTVEKKFERLKRNPVLSESCAGRGNVG